MYKILCDGNPFNSCKNMSEVQARLVFEMYADPIRGANNKTFSLVDVASSKTLAERKVARPSKGGK